MSTVDLSFSAMGSDVRLVLEGRRAADAAVRCRALIDDVERRLSRFRPESELCRLNADPATDVAASPLLRAAVRAGVWAAVRTGGLVDPTLVTALEAAGYAHSRSGPELSLREALHDAPPRHAARPHPARRWTRIVVDDRRGRVQRPPGVRFDTGGTGKGLAADLAVDLVHGCARWAVDCGGDLRSGGPETSARPFPVEIAHPLGGGTIRRLWLRDGAVATSGLDVRLWRRPDGTPAHHLLDPSTGRPAWTGAIGATALAPTAVEAEALAKAALLSGPVAGRRWLSTYGGLIVRDDGEVEFCGPLRPRLTLHLPRGAAA